MHRRLVEAVRSGAEIKEEVIVGGLTDRQAYRLESRLIAEFHKFRTDQLWNTIDERFMDPRWLSKKWHDPENVLYRLPRPPGIQCRAVRPRPAIELGAGQKRRLKKWSAP
jgi:hypothetical protein